MQAESGEVHFEAEPYQDGEAAPREEVAPQPVLHEPAVPEGQLQGVSVLAEVFQVGQAGVAAGKDRGVNQEE